MTLILQLSEEQEKRLREKASHAGLDPEGYLRQLIDMPDTQPTSLAESLQTFIGVLDGTPGPGDGRAWSEIEAPCDPL